MSNNEWERGYRDGIAHAADLLEQYVDKFRVTGPASRHLFSCAEGLREGAVARDIEGKGQ